MLEHFHGKENKMKNRKKIFIIIAVLSTFCFSICGCSKDKDKDISKKQLYASICNPNMQGVKEALKNHAELAKETIKTSSKTKPLELAVREIESEKVQLQICSQLIKSGADVNEKGDEITALKGTVSRIPFENYNEKMDMLNRLLESGAKPDSDIVSFLLNNDNSNWGMQYYFTLQILKKLEKYDGKPCDVWEFILAFGDKKSFKTLESLGHQPTKEEIYDTYQNYGKEQYEQGVKVKEDEVRQYSYDANGNQTDVKNTKTGQTESYTYDAENRLSKVSVTDKDGKTAVIQQNRYNGDGQRIQKVEGSKTTNYYYQDGVVSYTTDGENSQTSQNLIGTDGNILATQRYGSDHTDYLLYHKDIQGSSTSLVKEDGSADATYQYTDFGETTINGDNKVENEVCYTGGIYDQSTGLYYLNARYYNPEDGRFVTEDTYRGETAKPETGHLYAYCANNPVNYVDPSGHKAKTVIYYNKKGKDFKKQAMHSPYYKNSQVTFKSVIKKAQFKKEWDKIPKGTSELYLYLHGGVSCLYFDGSDMNLKELLALKKKKIKKKIVLLSCKGGIGDKNSVAKIMAKKCQCVVYASSYPYGLSYRYDKKKKVYYPRYGGKRNYYNHENPLKKYKP